MASHEHPSGGDVAAAPQRVRRGGQVLRGDATDTPTFDQLLLDGRRPGDAARPAADVASTTSEAWRVLRIQAEFVEGFGALAELGPAVSIFGSARTPVDSPRYAQGIELGRLVAEAGYAVITGGGPGAMEAANRGAREAGGTSVGLGIELPFEAGLNPYCDLGINFRYFFARKTMFLKYSQAFICLPGGMGTMDEFFEVMCMVQTGKVTNYPIVLMGTEYWTGLLEWMDKTLAAGGFINESDRELFLLTDDPDEALSHIIKRHEVMSDKRIREPR